MSKKLFEAYLTEQQLAQFLSDESPGNKARSIAVGLLTKDSDQLIGELEINGRQQFDDIADAVLEGLDHFAFQIKLMALAIERARMMTLLAEKQSDSDSLN